MAKTITASVDDYIARFDPKVRDVLQRVRSVIRRALPKADEVISYSIPAYRLHGGVVIYFAGWKEHVSIYPATGQVTQVFGKQLAPYNVSKGTIRFPLSEPVPAGLIAGVAKLRAKEAAARVADKVSAKKKVTSGKAPVKKKPTPARARSRA